MPTMRGAHASPLRHLHKGRRTGSCRTISLRESPGRGGMSRRSLRQCVLVWLVPPPGHAAQGWARGSCFSGAEAMKAWTRTLNVPIGRRMGEVDALARLFAIQSKA